MLMDSESKLRNWVDWLIAEMRNGLLEAIRPILDRRYGGDWEQKKLLQLLAKSAQEPRPESSTVDSQVVFRLVQATWSTDLEPHGWGRYIRQHVVFFNRLRNAWAHYEPISERELLDAFGRAKVVMKGLGDSSRHQLFEDQEKILRDARKITQGQLAFQDGSEAEADVVNSMPQLEVSDLDAVGHAAQESVWNSLNHRQRVLVRQRNKSGYRRIRGSAGSGKTVVIAARAVQCASEEKRVLVMAYNKTMVGYIRTLIRGCAVRTDQEHVLSNIECKHYHGWCLELLDRAGIRRPTAPRGQSSSDAWHDYNRSLGESAQHVLSGGKDWFEAYDAIMVDEGQDFYLEWWQCLRLALKEGEDEDGHSIGEMLLAADATQDLYGTASAWTDEAMNGAGFRGPWFELEASYRMPPALIPLISLFVDEYLPHTTLINRPVPSDASPDTYPFSWTWKNIGLENGLDTLQAEIERLVGIANGRKIVVQVPSKLGLPVVQLLSSKGIETSHIFDYQGTNSKDSFTLKPGLPGVITPHSFKGCEAPLVIAWIDTFGRSDKRNAAYVALTRVQRHEKGSELVVLNNAPELARLPEDWQSLESGFAEAAEEFY
jgi:ribosomal protein L18E